MLYNKNNVRKTNDKKILHKVGKQWKVISVALLMAIGGGAAVAATNNNANAQSTNGASVNVQSEAANLENDNYKAPQSASASSAASTSAKAPSLVSVNYAPSARVYGNNASAASYNNHADFDKATIQYYGPTVKKYVNSINAKYPEANSLATNVTSAKNAASNDNSLASSYSATAKDPSAASTVSGLALKAGLTTSAYVDSVMYQQKGYAGQVSAGSNNMSAMSYAASLASAVLNGNTTLSAASASATLANVSASAKVAEANSSAHANVVNAVVNANDANQKALTNAEAASQDAAVKAEVAGVYSGIDSATVMSAAKVASGNSSDYTSASVSSAVSALASNANSLASKGKTEFYFSNGTDNDVNSAYAVNMPNGYNTDYVSLAANNKKNTVALSVGGYNLANDASASDMMRVVSDTAALSAQASVSASATSTIASAEAYKAAHANDLSSAEAQTSNDSANVSAAKNALVSAGINYAIASTVASGVDKANGNKVTYANGMLNAIAGFINANGTVNYGAEKDYAKVILGSNPSLASTYHSAVSSAKAKVEGIDFSKDPEVQNSAKAYAANNSNVKNDKNNVENYLNAAKTADAAHKATDLAKANEAKAAAEADAKAAADQYANNLKDTIKGYISNKDLTGFNNDSNIPLVVKNVVNGEVKALKGTVEGDLANLNINVSALKNGNVNAFAANVLAAETSSANNATYGTMANLSNAVSLTESSAATSYNNVVSASNSYSTATDQDVTLASYFASSYTSEANSASNVASSDASALNSYYVATANNAEFTNAFNAYNTANGVLSNDETLAHAYGVNVLHHSPQFVTLTKDAVLHTGVGFNKKNAVKSVKVGSQFAVKGVGFDEVGTLRYVVGTDDNQPVYLTANDAYVENSYLEPDGAATVKFAKNANAHKGLNFNSKVVGSVKAGQTVTGNIIATLSDNSYDHYFGVARLQLSDGSFVTANKNYFAVVPSTTNNNDHSESAKSNNNYVRDLVLFK